jgi:PAP2 superfamily protein
MFATTFLLLGLASPPLVSVAVSDPYLTSIRPLSDPSPATDSIQSSAAGTPDKPGDQDQADAKKPPTPPHTGIHALLDGLKEDIRHLPSKPNLELALIGGGLAAAVHPADNTFNVKLRSHYDVVNAAFAPAKYYGDTPEQVALSLGTYAFGRIFDKPKASHLGMDLLRAQAITEMLVEPLKFATHRQRPDGSNHQSFPSGHSAVTFAAATVIERHLGWKKSVLGYAIASYVAASRLHDNRHYLSDVVFGAAVGSIAGRTVTEHGREMWTFTPAPVPGGVAIFATRAGRDDR